jgi:2'-5' RNA ligase
MQRLVRTFIAVELSPDVRGSAARLIERFRQTAAKVRWVENRNLHLTLKFLGDVASVELPQVIDTVRRAIEGLHSFDLHFRGAGAFPDAENPRTIWLGVAEGAERMVEIHRRVEDALAELGFRAENRRFRPHVTLGRVRDTRFAKRDLKGLLAQYAEFEGGISLVDELVVFSSELTEDGPNYEPIGRVELPYP